MSQPSPRAAPLFSRDALHPAALARADACARAGAAAPWCVAFSGGADSLALLGQIATMVRDQGWVIVDVDTVVIAEKPKLASYRGQMRINLSETLGIAPECLGVKATTTEGLGFEGRGEGIAAQAVVLLERLLCC